MNPYPGIIACPKAAPDETVKTTLAGGAAVACQGTLEPQMNALGKDTDLVLLTFGGDDVNFADIVKDCFATGFRHADTCRTKVTSAQNNLATVQSNLTAVFATMRHILRPDAKVVMLGYPQLVGSYGYVLKSHNLLHQVTDTYDAGSAVRALGVQGHDIQQAAVNAANTAAGTNFVTYINNVIPTFSGHEPDPRPFHSNGNAWLNELASTFTVDEWYHPNSSGHDAYASLLENQGTFGAGGTSASGGSLDLAFVIDTTGSMAGTIDAVKNQVEAVADQLAAGTSSYRLAVVSYRDQPAWTGDPSDYASHVDEGFTSDAGAVKTTVAGLVASGGGDTPESAYSGIKAALDLNWRPGVKKEVIVFTDAPAHDPEPVTGLTATDVISEAQAIDPAVVSVINTGGADQLAPVATGTGGVITAATTPEDIAAALTNVVSTSVQGPYAWAGETYVGAVGHAVNFDASGSFDPSGEALSYSWDVNSDGTPDATTTSPKLDWTYGADYNGKVTVKVTNSSGQSSTANADVVIDEDGDGIPAAIDNCPSVANVDQADTDGDGIGDACDPTPGLPTADAPDVTVESTVNSVPTTAPEEFTTPANQNLVVATPGVLAGDSDPDPDDTITAALLSQPTHGTISLAADGSFTYTPSAGFQGDDTFQYQAVDNHGTVSGTTTDTIHVVAPETIGQRVLFSVEGHDGFEIDGKVSTGGFTWKTTARGAISTVSGTATIRSRHGDLWTITISGNTSGRNTTATVTVTGPHGFKRTFTGKGILEAIRNGLLGEFVQPSGSAKRHGTEFGFVVRTSRH
jgi:VCBS repeat-containing protein